MLYGRPSGARADVVDAPRIDPGAATPIVFVDALKQSTPWMSRAKLSLAPEGDITALPAGRSAWRVVYAPGQARVPGDYTLLYQGHGAFRIEGGHVIRSAPGRDIVSITASTGNALVLRLLSVDPADPPHDVRLILPGFERVYAVKPFYPPFVASLRGAGVIDFSAWSRAGTLAQSQVWPLRPRVAHVTQADSQGVAPEYMIELADETGAVPCIALPAGATDAYAWGTADLVHRFLDARSRAIFEYASPAMRSAASPLGRYALEAARNTGLGVDPAKAPSAWYEYRSARLRAVVAQAFGADANRVSFAVDGVIPDVAAQMGPSVVATHFAIGDDSAPPPERDGPPPFTLHPMPPYHAALAGPPASASARSPSPSAWGAFGDPLPGWNVAAEGSTDWLVVAGARIERKTNDGGLALQFPTPTRRKAALGVGSTALLTAPAGPSRQVLRLYFTAIGPASIEVRIGGKLATATFHPPHSAAARDAVYTIVYSAPAAGTLSLALSPAGPSARAVLRAATLAPYLGTGPGPTDEPTYHNGTLRLGWNPYEHVLNVANVGSPAFGLLRTLTVDGDVLAQPLYLAGVRGHNVVYVVTEHDSVYKFDADSGALLRRVSLGTSQQSNDVGCLDISPEYGITSTPVIDRASGTMYVVAATEPSPGQFHTTLHALDIATLKDTVPPVEIAATTTLSNGRKVSFQAQYQQIRSSLAFANGSLYFGVGSHCDNDPGGIIGWILRYDTGLHLIGQFATEDDPTSYLLSSVWMTGFAPVIDDSGNVYVVTGNGAFDHQHGGNNYGESVLELPPDLSSVADSFTPSNWYYLNKVDGDFGSGGIMGLPPQQGAIPDLAVAMGKDSTLYLLDRSHLGGVGDANAVQAIGNTGGGVWGGPAYYSGPTGQFVYYQAGGAPLLAFSLAPNAQGVPNLTLSSTGPSYAGYGGSSPVVSSNGQAPGTGVVWLVNRTTPLTLEAYDATDVSHLLFSGTAGTWTNPQNNGFVTPLVAAGKVYAPASGTVSVFGLRAIPSAAPSRSPSLARAGVHQLHGFVLSFDERRLILRLRDGRTSSVDIRLAAAAGRLGPLGAGRAVVVYGSIDRFGTFHATSIGHTSPYPRDWTRDL